MGIFKKLQKYYEPKLHYRDWCEKNNLEPYENDCAIHWDDYNKYYDVELTKEEFKIYADYQSTWYKQIKEFDINREKKKTHFVYNLPEYKYDPNRPDYKENRDVYAEFKAHYDEVMG